MDSKLFGAAQERQVPLREIDPDRGVQMREGFDSRKAAQYGERYREGVKLPPVVLFHDGFTYHRADGAHRIMGAMQADLGKIDALVYEGGRREALLYAAGANADFGLDRTDETIRTSILTLLRDPEWYEWSDRAIARHVTCSHTTVAKLRRQVDEERAAASRPAVPAQPGLFDAPQELVTERDPEEPRVRRGADGRAINTAKIGASKKQEQEEQRLRELLDQARELGAQDAAKGLRSQGELVRALGACPAGKLEVLWAAYRAALEEARGKAKTFQPASEATEALRGKPIGGPPLVLSASTEVEKAATSEDEDEEALCRICGKAVCEDVDACLAVAAAEDGEDLDEDDGAEEAPRTTALSVLGGLVNNLASDPARRGEVGAELLRLAGELGAQPAAEARTREAERDVAERERARSEDRERALHRCLFDLAAAWRRQGLDGPRADLVAILDGGAEDVAAVLGRSDPRRALPWKALARALRRRWLRAEQNDAEACAELQEARKERSQWAALHRKASTEVDALRRAVKLLREDAGEAGLVVCEHDDGEGGCDRICAPNPEGGALCPAHQAAQAEAAAAPILKPKAKGKKAKAPAAPPAAPRRDPATLTEADLPVSPGLRWEKQGAQWFAEPVVLRQMSFLEAFAVGDPVVTGYGCSYRIDGTCGRSGLRVRDARPGSKGGGQINDMIVLAPGVARQANSPGVKDPTAPIAIPIEDRFVVKVTEEQLSPILAKTLEDWGGDWGNQTAALKELARAALAAAMDAAAASSTCGARGGAGLICERTPDHDGPHATDRGGEVTKWYGGEVPAATPAAPTWQPASIGGAKAVHALPVGAVTAAGDDDGRRRWPAALCTQGPNYKSETGWTPRPGCALTCKGCLTATGGAS